MGMAVVVCQSRSLRQPFGSSCRHWSVPSGCTVVVGQRACPGHHHGGQIEVSGNGQLFNRA